MAAFGSVGYSGPKEVRYLFIDGGCLREAGRKFSNFFLDGEPIEFNFFGLRGGYTKAFYYDALPPRRDKENLETHNGRLENQKKYFRDIQSNDFFHVNIGAINGNSEDGLRQKGVDVRLAVDMMMHTMRGNTRNVALLTSDSDFIPLLHSLVENGVNVALWYDGQKANDHLIRSADTCLSLGPRMLKRWLSPRQSERLAAGISTIGGERRGGAPSGSTCIKNLEIDEARFSFYEKDSRFYCEHFEKVDNVENFRSFLGSDDIIKLKRWYEWETNLKYKALDF